MAPLPVAVRRALQERRASRERAGSEDLIRKLTLAVDQSPASVLITDTTGLIRYVNQRFEEVTGYASEEVLGRTPRILKSGRTPADVYRELWGTIRSGQVWHGELVNRRKNGAVYWDALSISPVRDTEGNITDFLAIHENITERKQTEEALKESEARFRKIIEASFDGIEITQDGVVLEANRGFAEMFGYTPEEVIGLPVGDFIAEESRESTLQRIGQHIEGSYELVGKRKDGRKILLEATARTHEIGGRPARVTALRDVTERRSHEEQVRQAQKMEAVGRLAGGVAHDFNNLLTVITSYAEILLGDLAANDARRADVAQIQKAATSAATLTAQLLAFSRQRAITPRLVALEVLVARSAKMLQQLLGEDIELVTTLSQEPLTVTIDPEQLEQIITNLAVNARDAMPRGGRVVIETAKVDLGEESVPAHPPMSQGQYAMLAMSDTGVGMDQQTRARIFEPFFRTKEVDKGTGLGLATVYSTVKQNGGLVWVHSEPGHGATFKIYLPLSGQSAVREHR
jgi:two-component system cell cycle sensor histidine kinase/response regulator CckA